MTHYHHTDCSLFNSNRWSVIIKYFAKYELSKNDLKRKLFLSFDPTCFEEIKGNKKSQTTRSIEILAYQPRSGKEQQRDRVPLEMTF